MLGDINHFIVLSYIVGETRRVVAVVPAAGKGSRIGSEVPKPLLPLGETSIVQRTLSKVIAVQAVQEVLLVVPGSARSLFVDALRGFDRVTLIPGGATRQESVAHALGHIERELAPDDATFVLIHDAARPFVSTELLERAIRQAYTSDAVTAAIPQVDSLKRVTAERVVDETVSREAIWAVQTPQVFRYTLLARAHASAAQSATDDAALVEALHPVTVVEGARDNFKITTAEDYALARKLA